MRYLILDNFEDGLLLFQGGDKLDITHTYMLHLDSRITNSTNRPNRLQYNITIRVLANMNNVK